MEELFQNIGGRLVPAPPKEMVRRPDYDTSISAANSLVPKRNKLQIEVLDAFRELGAMTDEELEQLPRFERYTYSTVRKRRTELFQRGEIEIVGDKLNSHGSRMKIWNVRY